MDQDVMQQICEGLTEKQSVLASWQETTDPEKRQIQTGLVGETCVQEHLHVIDESLQKIEAGTLGICEVCHGLVDESLLQMDYTSCVCLSHYTDEERHQLESELELSQVVQRALLPQQAPSISGFDIAAFSRPAQIVSGDYFDFLQFNDQTHGFVVADVSGHGVASGMLMTSLQAAFHTLTLDDHAPVTVLERINHLYIHNIKFTTFVTVFFASLDPQTRMLSYANAGHNPPLIYRKNSAEEIWLQPTGAAIGLREDYQPRLETVRLVEGDILLLYTDGVTESLNAEGEQFGHSRLANILRENEGLSSEGLTNKIRRTLNDFIGSVPPADDITLVVCKVS